MSNWLKELKVGDKVVVHIYRNHNDRLLVETVEKITPSGLIKVNGSLYYSDDGRLRGENMWGIQYLRNFNDEGTQAELTKQKERNYIRNTLAMMHECMQLSLEQAIEIRKILKEDK